MFDEDDLLPLSALQHFVFCERRCALVHIENVWAENALTIQGEHMHDKVHEDGDRTESRGDVRIARGLASISTVLQKTNAWATESIKRN
jgi:CRISPR-associated exonuclease Cas4